MGDYYEDSEKPAFIINELYLNFARELEYEVKWGTADTILKALA